MYDPIKDCDTDTNPRTSSHYRPPPRHYLSGRETATSTPYLPPPMDHRYPAYLPPSDYPSSRGPSYSHQISPPQSYPQSSTSHQRQTYDDSPGRRSSPQSSTSPALHSHGAGGIAGDGSSPHGPSSSSALAASLKPTLKRNQACLQCRRRKLKCDAARPHCKTCVRSYNHALRGADASRRERIRERQRERGEEERDDAGDDNDEEPPAESLIPALSCTYEDPTEIQAKRQESAALTQKRYGQQIGAARILVEGLAGGSGLVRVDSSGDEVWETARHPGVRKRSVGSLMGGRNGTPEYGRPGKRRDTSQTHEQRNGRDRSDHAESSAGGQAAAFIDPGLLGETVGYGQTSPGSSSRRPPSSLPLDLGYHPGGYGNQHPIAPPPPPPPPPPPLQPPAGYSYHHSASGNGMGPLAQLPPGRGPPWESNHMPPSLNRAYDGYTSSYDRSGIKQQDPMPGFQGPAHNYFAPGPPPHMLDGLNPPRSNGLPFPEPLLPPPLSYGPPESSARESLRRESVTPLPHMNGQNGALNGSSVMASAQPRMSAYPDDANGGGQFSAPERVQNGMPAFDVAQLDPRLGQKARDDPGWEATRGSVSDVMPRKADRGEAEENAQLRSKIAWLEAELRQNNVQQPPQGAPSSISVDPRSPGSHLGSATAVSNGRSQTGGPEDGNMLALLSQAIDQSGYEPVSASAHANGQRKTNNVSTFRGSTTPLKPKTIFEIAPAESWAATIDSSRARTLANILNETTDVDMGDVKPFEMPESGMPEIVSGEDMQKSEAEPVLWDLLWPGWNKNLPNPELMDHIIEVFFHHVPTVTRLFHYETFKARMALPATHKDFPNVAVLHGICAAAARYTARVFTCNPEDEPWLRAGEHMEDPRREEDFGIRHSLLAWQVINMQLNLGVHIYESAQSLILLANHHHMYARWAEGWLCIGLAARLMPPLGLSVKERANAGTGPGGRGPFLPLSLNGIEREERRALFWASVLYDIQISASSGWAGIIQQDEVFVPLPASLEAFEAGVSAEVPESDQTLHSPDIWSRHPARDGFVFHVKAMCLFHRVTKFVRILKAKRAMGGAEVDVRASKEFQDLDASIATFLNSFPSDLRDPLTPCSGKIKKPIDVDLFTAQVVLHQMTIFLHEPFANLDIPDDPSNQRLLEASRSILKMIFAITSTCLDLSLISRADFGLHTAARTLVLFLRHAVRTGDTSAGTEEQLRSEVEVFRLAFIAHGKRFPIGLRHSKVLGAMLADCGPDRPCASAKQLAIESASVRSPSDTKPNSDNPEATDQEAGNGVITPAANSTSMPPASTKSESIPLKSPSVATVTPVINGLPQNGHPVKFETVALVDTRLEPSESAKLADQHELNAVAHKQAVPPASAVQA